VTTMRSPSALVVVLVLALSPYRASADAIAGADRAAEQELDAAEQALHDLRYEQASSLLDQARRSGQNGPRALARLYRLQGELAATLGDAPRARGAFARWLAIDRQAALASGTSPKITVLFEAAAAQLDGKSLHVAFHLVDDGSAVALEVVSDPLGMVAGARAFYPGRADLARSDLGLARGELAPPRAGRLQVVVAALDLHGNRLVEHELTLGAPAAVDPPARPSPSPGAVKTATPPAPARVAAPAPARAARPRFHQGWVWSGAAIGFGMVGGYYGIRALQAQDDLEALNDASGEHTYLEARATADRLRTSAIVANASVAVAGVCALAAVLLWPDAPRDHPVRRLRGQMGRDGARVTWEWSW
jgi:hypothetical protein